MTASRDDERAALLPWLRQARPRSRSLSSRGLVTQAGYPGTRIIPAVNCLLSLLAPKLTRTRRVSHVDDMLADPAAALLAGLTVLPKKSGLTSYSYRLSHDHQERFPGVTAQQVLGELDARGARFLTLRM